MPDEGFNSGQKTVLGELGQRQEPLHLAWLVRKDKPELEQGSAECSVAQQVTEQRTECAQHTQVGVPLGPENEGP